MKKLALVLLAFIAFSCGGEKVEKPKRLLSENEMENIIYDITILQAIRSSQPQVLSYNNLKPKEYIFKKYKIDSLIFAQNNAWYTDNLETYEKIQKKVSERIKAERDKNSQTNDTVKKAAKPDVSGARAKRDSLKRAALDKVKLSGTQK